jgi:DNA-binding IclR family transcriptional regulator
MVDVSMSRQRSHGSGAPADGNGSAAPRPYTALQGVGRAMEIVEAVAERPMRASEIAERLGLKWTTAHRSLSYLLENNYLRRDDDSGIYRIGPRLYYLGQSYLHNHPLIDSGATALRALAHESGATAQLNEREGLEATVLMGIDPALEMIPKTSVEHRFPLHVGSKGQVLLAYADPSVFEELIATGPRPLTPSSITDPQELADVLAEIRAHGYRVTLQDVQMNTGSIAAPIFSGNGEIAGSVCVIVKAPQLTDERTEELVSAVSSVAREISIRLGWRYGDQPAALERWAAFTPPSER